MKPQHPVFKIQGKPQKTLEKIGSGSNSQVYKACDQKGQNYALKVVSNYAKEQKKKDVDLQVSTQMLFTDCKNIVKCFGKSASEDGKEAYIKLELGQCTLHDILEQWKKHKEVKEEDILRILLDISKGLSQIHSKDIIHGDIKPQNIIYIEGGYKISDFGISVPKKRIGSQKLGTLRYYAPEMLFNHNMKFGKKVDVWAFGIIAFKVLFGMHPFNYHDSNNAKIESIEQQIKENIDKLTPNFTVDRFIKHIRQKGFKQQADRITRQKNKTNPQLMQLFKFLFQRDRNRRPNMQSIVTALEILSSTKIFKNPDKFEYKELDHPLDIAWLVETKKLFQALGRKQPYKGTVQVEFLLELNIWMIQQKVYAGTKFVNLTHQKRIRQVFSKFSSGREIYGKDKTKQWIAKCSYYQEVIWQHLRSYFYYLNKQKMNIFQEINRLKLGILMCSYWSRALQNEKAFCKEVRKITGFDMITTLQQVKEIAILYTKQHLQSIAKFIWPDSYSS